MFIEKYMEQQMSRFEVIKSNIGPKYFLFFINLKLQYKLNSRNEEICVRLEF